jgi:oxidoreductase
MPRAAFPRVALLGAGMSARSIWGPVLQAANLSVTTVIDPDPQVADGLRPILGDITYVSALPEADLSMIDLIVIASPNRFHKEHACYCLSRGVPTLIEKPACFSVFDAQEIIAAAGQDQTPFWCSSASRERHDVMAIQGLIDNGQVGDIYSIALSWRRSKGVPRPGSWFTDKSIAIGGSGADLGWHMLDVGLGILHYPTLEQGHCIRNGLALTAETQESWYAGSKPPTRSAEFPFDVENQMVAALFSKKCQITMSTAWVSHQRFDTTRVKVLGTRAEIDLNCTFGFSPNGIRNSFISILRNGSEEYRILSEGQKIDPYVRFAERVARELRDPNRDNRAESAKLLSLGRAMEILYPEG